MSNHKTAVQITKPDNLVKLLHVLSWIAFIALCIKTGILLITTIISLYNPESARHLYLELDLSNLLASNRALYIKLLSLVIFTTVLKAVLFYNVTKLFSKINIADPFRLDVTKLISTIAYNAFAISLLTIITTEYAETMMKKSDNLNQLQNFLGGGQEMFFMGGIIFLISYIFKRGIELQEENALTV